MSVEGMSCAAIARVEGIAWHTADRWLAKAAELAQRFNERHIYGIPLVELQADELRTFAPCKAKPTWVFTSMEVCSRLWSSTVVGRRSPTHARCERRLHRQLELARCHYNFIRRYTGLRFGREFRTPAMVAALRDRVCNFRDVFAFA